MKNEVYGSIQLSVSTPVKSTSEKMAILEANYEISDERFFKSINLSFEDAKGNIHRLDVHMINKVSWDKFFSEDE